MVAYEAALKRVSAEEARRAPAGGGEAKNALQRFDEQLSKHIGLLEAEASSVGKTVAIREQERQKALLNEALKRSGIQLNEEELAQRERLIAQSGQLAQKRAEERESLQQLINASRQLGDALANAFADIVLEGQKFNDALKDLSKSLARMAIQESFRKIFTAPASAGGIPDLLKLLGVGSRQAGGPVSGGAPYMVGEKGPELFVPSRGGVIVPNSAIRGGGGGAAIEQNVVINDYSGQAKVRQKQASEGGGVEVFIPAIEQCWRRASAGGAAR